jgi:hypothetical protein
VPKPTPAAATSVAAVTATVEIPAHLCSSLLRTAEQLHAANLKAFGLLLGDPADSRYPFRAVDVTVFDPLRNRRNDPAYRTAFHAQGSYFRQYEDADSSPTQRSS